MSKNKNKQIFKPYLIAGLSVFWIIVWVIILSLQVFGSVGFSLLMIDLDTILVIVTVVTLFFSTHSTTRLKWVKIKHMHKGKR